MAIRAKKLKILDSMVLVITVLVMDLENQFTAIPFPDSTDLTMSIVQHDPVNILLLQIHSLDLRSQS